MDANEKFQVDESKYPEQNTTAPNLTEVPRHDSRIKIANAVILPVANTTVHAATPPAPANDDEVVAMLAVMTPLEYERVRVASAEELGIRKSALDALVNAARKVEQEVSDQPFADVQPHAEPVVVAPLLSDIQNIIKKHIVLEPLQAIAVTLWIAFTWMVSVVGVAPLLLIGAPERACGKTHLIELLDYLVCRSMTASSMRAATLFRIVDAWHPTLLIDEIDTFIKNDSGIAGLLNAGHTKTTAWAWRSTGQNHSPTRFNVYGAKALAGISPEKHLPEATISRSIFIEMRRKKPDESVISLRDADKDELGVIKSKLARFAEDYADQVRKAKPVLPETLDDRSKDNWLPLLAIAECAGEEWVASANSAATKLSASTKKSASIGEQLLSDIRRAFDASGAQRIRRDQLLMTLCSNDEAPWATYNKGEAITSNQFANLLSVYGISSYTIRFGAGEVVRGYRLDQFADAFDRYLPTGVTPLQANHDADLVVSDEVISAEAVTVSVTAGKPAGTGM